jgi:CheY-like chemotaxis protein
MDAHQFEQLLVNLVVNARDAMPEGGQLTLQTANVTLTPAEAELFSALGPGEYVQLTVSDTGVGMSQEVKTHLFEPFFTTKPVGEGTGLGLPTCLGIVQQHGGDIVVESVVGRGTTFKIYLPCREQPVSPERKEPRLYPQGSELILLVEDENEVRELITRVLRQQGYTVLEATNGEDALQLLATQPEVRPQLLLTDVVMPRLGGKALLARLKPLYPELKVLFISGYTHEMGALQEDISTWQASFLVKPFTPTKLAQSVRAILDSYPR